MLVRCATRCISRSLRVFRSTVVCARSKQLARPVPYHHNVRLTHSGAQQVSELRFRLPLLTNQVHFLSERTPVEASQPMMLILA